MTGLELAPFIYAVPVAMAMFANSDRHSTMEKVSRRQRRQQQRSSGWLQEHSNVSVPARTRRRMMASPPSSPSLPSPPVIDIDMDIEPSSSIEMTLEDFHQA